MAFLSFLQRLPAGLACLLVVSATTPQPLTVQIFDQRGLPVEGAVIEIAAPPGITRPLAFP